MSTPWLTIVTVLRDDLPGLERTLASLGGVLDASIQYIVVDSSHDHESVATLVADSAPSAEVIWEEPSGIYPAMNAGLNRARGRYIYFLNAGDELNGQGLFEARKEVEAKSPVWLTAPVEIEEVNGQQVTSPPWAFESESAWAFARGNFPAHQGTIVATEALRSQGGFDIGYRIAADYASMLTLSRKAPPVMLDEPLARFHEGGASTVGWHRAHREFHRARRKILKPTGSLAAREYVATGRRFLAEGAYRSPWPLAGVLGLLAVVLLTFSGVGALEAAASTAVVAIQGVSGAVAWRLATPGRSTSVLELVGAGLALGTAGSLVAGLIWTWWLFPILIAVLWIAGRSRRTSGPIGPLDRNSAWGLVLGLGTGLAALAYSLRSYPLTWSGAWDGYHGDLPFFEALGSSVNQFGPSASIFMTGAELRYHSLSYAWSGQVSYVAAAEPFVVLTRVLPLVAILALVALAASWARRMSARAWIPALAALLVVTGGFVGATFGGVVNFDSPSQTLTTVWLMLFSILLIAAVPNGRILRPGLALALLSFVMAGGKVSTAVVAVGALVGVAAVVILRREYPIKRVAWLTAFIGIPMLAAYLLLIEGSANAGGLGLFQLTDRASSVQGLNPVVTPRGIVAGIAVLVMAVVPRWAGIVWLLRAKDSRWSLHTWLGLGLAATGISTIVVLSGGFNDLWFAVAASAPLAVLSAVGLGNAWDWMVSPGRVRAAAIAGLVVSVVIAALWTTGSSGILGIGWRWAASGTAWVLAALAGLLLARGMRGRFKAAALALALTAIVFASLPSRVIYAAATPFVTDSARAFSTVLFTPLDPPVDMIDSRTLTITSDELAAGRWLRENAVAGDVVVTNRTADAIVPALTRLPTYMSNIHIQAPYGRSGTDAQIIVREKLSWTFINEPTDDRFAQLCAADAQWLWVDTTRTDQRSWEPYATVAFESPTVIVARVESDSCP